MKRVNFGSTTETGDSDYQGCTELSELTGTDNLKTIGANTFNGCEKLENFKFGSSLNSIGEAAFAHTRLATADMSSSSLESIGAWAFAGNSHLGNVLLPKMMKSIGDGAFFDCPALTNITLPEGIATLADYTFKGASKLESMAVPEGITNIGQYALKGADNIIDVTLPSSLESIGDNAMEGMSALKYIGATALTAVPALGKDVWNDVNQPAVRLDVNEDIANEFESAEQWQDFDINPINSSEAPIIAIDSISVRGRFDGYTLHIVATGVEINYIELFDTAGIQLMRYDTGGADSAAIDTSTLSTSIFMVRCTLSNNTAASLKLARK